MKQDAIRRSLIDGTIHVIAKNGLDKASTKQISLATSINEAYIYRYFNDKEDLFAKYFAFLDNQLVEKTIAHFPIMNMTEMNFEMRCWAYFTAIWRFVIGNQNECSAYVQYFYSPYYPKHSADEHKARFMPLVNMFKSAFRDEADVWMILNHILNVILDFAIKVHRNIMPGDDSYTEHVFRVIYTSVKQYFKEGVLIECATYST